MDEISRRRKGGPCRFTLLIPDAADRGRANWTLETALPLLRRAAGGPVEGVACGPDPLASIRDAVAGGAFDEIIVTAVVPRQVRVDPDLADSSAFRAGIIMGG
jgi:hypothetical protein